MKREDVKVRKWEIDKVRENKLSLDKLSINNKKGECDFIMVDEYMYVYLNSLVIKRFQRHYYKVLK
jgi:hypothetical protein